MPPRFRPEAPTRAAKESAEGGAGSRPLVHARTPTNKLIEPKAEAKEQGKEDKSARNPKKAHEGGVIGSIVLFAVQLLLATI